MKQEKQNAEFEEWYVKTFETALTELPRLVEICFTKEISRCYEEKRHMENIDEIGNQIRRFGMPHHHEYDSQSLDYGYSRISHYCFNCLSNEKNAILFPYVLKTASKRTDFESVTSENRL